MADRSWPPALRFSESLFQIVDTSRSSGQSMSGQEQVVQSPAGRWKAAVTVPIADRRHGPVERQNAVLAYRSIIKGGRARVILLPTCDGRGPAHLAGLFPKSPGVPFSDGARFSDGAFFRQSYTGAVFAEPCAMNATQIQISLGYGLTLLPGQRFSTPDGRLHEIDDVLYFDGGNLWTMTVAPWLRADYPAGTALDFDRPVCRMRLASDETGALNLSLNRFATPTIEFVEAF